MRPKRLCRPQRGNQNDFWPHKTSNADPKSSSSQLSHWSLYWLSYSSFETRRRFQENVNRDCRAKFKTTPPPPAAGLYWTWAVWRYSGWRCTVGSNQLKVHNCHQKIPPLDPLFSQFNVLLVFIAHFRFVLIQFSTDTGQNSHAHSNSTALQYRESRYLQTGH